MAEMAATPIIEFVVTKFKPDATVEQEGTQAHKTWQEILVLLRGVVGIKKNYWGRQLEDPSLVLHVLIWTSPADHTAFTASPAYGAFRQGLTSLAADPDGAVGGVDVVRVVSGAEHLAGALDAPCTEVFTAYGAEPAFPAATAAFAAKVAAEPPAAFRGAAVCDSGDDVDAADRRGRVVKLLVGWDSREAHLAAKGKPGPISDNIQLLREGKKAGAMFHVQLTAL